MNKVWDQLNEEARKIVYGMPYSDWKSKHQMEASADQVTKFKEANPEHQVF